jgi:tetratricopeptide (TPR) repeat protein
MEKKLAVQSLKYLEAGQFNKAAKILAQLISNYPQNAEAYHMMSLIELERGNYEYASTLIKQAVELSPNNAVFYNTMGNIELHCKKYDSAEQAFILAGKYAPEKIEYKYNLAHFYLGQNQYQKAINLYYYILHINPTHYLSIRGITVCYLFSNEPEIALEHATSWVEEYGIYDEPYYYLGLCYYALNNLPMALAAYDRGLSLNPNNFEILTAIGACYHALGNFRIAESYLLRSLNLDSNNPTATYNLARVNLDQGKLDTAQKLFLNAIGLDHNYAEPICGLGYIELINNNPKGALSFFEQAKLVEPSNPKPKLLAATTLLRMQNFKKGWPAYREVFTTPSIIQDVTLWHGQLLPTPDARLLVWAPKENYDFAQQIMFLSVLPDLSRLGHKVVILCDQNLKKIIKRSFPEFETIHSLDASNMQHREAKITHQIPLNCLGEILRRSESDFTNNMHPYLKADPELTQLYKNKYAQLFGTKKLIGIAWRSSSNTHAIDHVKSSNLHDWLPILQNTEYQFISLQPDYPINDEHNIYVDLETTQDELAEQIASLDAVITVDNYVASLAGALGVEVLTMLPKQCEWYWFADLENSIWYPNMRIFRQEKTNDWSHPIKAISKFLSQPGH